MKARETHCIGNMKTMRHGILSRLTCSAGTTEGYFLACLDGLYAIGQSILCDYKPALVVRNVRH